MLIQTSSHPLHGPLFLGGILELPIMKSQCSCMATSARASDVIDCAYMYMNIHMHCVMLARAMHYNRGGSVWMCSKILFLMSAV